MENMFPMAKKKRKKIRKLKVKARRMKEIFETKKRKNNTVFW